jgi:hypothetical protein
MDKNSRVKLLIYRDKEVSNKIKNDLAVFNRDKLERIEREKEVDEMMSKASKYLNPKQIEQVRKRSMSLSKEEFEDFKKRAENIVDGIVLENIF